VADRRKGAKEAVVPLVRIDIREGRPPGVTEEPHLR
jgi:hypothetical protein